MKINLIDILWLSLKLILGALIIFLFGKNLSSNQKLIYFVVVFIGVHVVFFIIGWLGRKYDKTHPLFPECENGKEIIKYLRSVESGQIFICECRDEYFFERPHSFKARRILKVDNNGSLTPYLIRHPFRKWEKDTSE